jgi:arylsulfatase A-like enzyme
VPSDIQGKSFKGLLSNKRQNTDWRKAMYYHYYEYPEPHRVAPHIGIRTERYKLIRFYGAISKWELYDLQNDPHEMKNIINEPSNQSLIIDLKNQLVQLAAYYKDDEGVKIISN